MTLKNAKHRFGAIGYEVEKAVLGGYKARRIGATRWTQADCLEWLLTACQEMVKRGDY